MKKIIILASTVIVLILIEFFVFNDVNKNSSDVLIPSPSITSQNVKTFKSSTLDFIIQVPESYDIKEQITFVNLSRNGFIINVSRNATNFDSLKDYLDIGEEKNKIISLGRKTSLVGGLDASVSLIRYQGDSETIKVFDIMVDNWVYSFSTTSQELYSDLDQIAQSFKYTP